MFYRIALGVNLFLFVVLSIITYRTFVISKNCDLGQINEVIKIQNRIDPKYNRLIDPNSNKIFKLLFNLAKGYTQNSLQITKIGYEIESNVAEVSIKSADLNNLYAYLVKLDELLWSDQSYISEIKILDKDNKPIVDESFTPNTSAFQGGSSMLQTLMNLISSKNSVTKDENLSAAEEEEDTTYQYNVMIKIGI
jgi:hypothetical protein